MWWVSMCFMGFWCDCWSHILTQPSPTAHQAVGFFPSDSLRGTRHFTSAAAHALGISSALMDLLRSTDLIAWWQLLRVLTCYSFRMLQVSLSWRIFEDLCEQISNKRKHQTHYCSQKESLIRTASIPGFSCPFFGCCCSPNGHKLSGHQVKHLAIGKNKVQNMVKHITILN